MAALKSPALSAASALSIIFCRSATVLGAAAAVSAPPAGGVAAESDLEATGAAAPALSVAGGAADWAKARAGSTQTIVIASVLITANEKGVRKRMGQMGVEVKG